VEKYSQGSYAGDIEQHFGSTNSKLDPNDELDINNPKYQLFLVRRYSIERNNTLDKFIIWDELFEDLGSALTEADARYRKEIQK